MGSHFSHEHHRRVDQSLSWIEKAWRVGYRDLAHTRKDSDLKNVQSDSRFETLLARLSAELVAFQDGTEIIHELPGEKAGDQFGWVAGNAGDVDADGFTDLIVGAWRNSDLAPSAGKAYLISMKNRKLLKTFTCRANGDTFGFDSTGLGDVNGDGAPDFLITSAYSGVNGPQSGRVFVISGKL